MPAKQQGDVIKRGRVWQARWSDDQGKRRSRSGYETKTAAREFLKAELDRVGRLRRGEEMPAADRPATVDVLLDLFLEKHGRTIDPATTGKLTTQLKKARAEFGERGPDTLKMAEIEDWRELLPAGSRHDCFRAFRQALAWGVARGLVNRDASAGIKNPKRKRHERRDVFPFETWAEVEKVVDELDKRYRAIPILLVGTGLRPEEAFGLHRSDIEGNLLHVRRRFSSGAVKEGGKTPGSVRVVPLRQKVLDALAAMPPRIDTPILFPAPRGGYIDLEKFRHREWAPALRAAGLTHHRVYDTRHTFATWAIRDGVPTMKLAKLMGTSVGQLEDTYVRWLQSDDDDLRAVFNKADGKAATG